MKLYTEEQVLKIIQKSVMDKPQTYYEVLKDYTPIELPSDEEIEEESSKWRAPSQAFRGGAKWMRDKITNTKEI